jgi:hypothetical protein
MKHLKKHFTGMGVALASCVLTSAGAAMAQTAPPPDTRGGPEQVQPGTVAEAEETGPSNDLSVHGLFGIDFTTHYISRGLVLEDQGFIAQPYAELGFTLAEGNDDGVGKFTLFTGIWNSLHENKTDAGLAAGGLTTTPIWYEFDWYAGVSYDFADNFNLNLSYWEFTSPNEGFGVSKNVQAKVSFDDTDVWGKGGFALKPYGIVFVETNGKAGSGTDEGIYFEVGVEPTVYTFSEDSSYPLAISVPIKVGMGTSDFYEDDDFLGFVTVGVKGSVPLAFIPAEFGAWSGYAGVYYYMYGEGVDDFNEGTGDGDDDIVGAAGVSMTF